MSGPIKLSTNMRAEMGQVADWAQLDSDGYDLLLGVMRRDPDARAIVRAIAYSFVPRPEDELLKRTSRMSAEQARAAISAVRMVDEPSGLRRLTPEELFK